MKIGDNVRNVHTKAEGRIVSYDGEYWDIRWYSGDSIDGGYRETSLEVIESKDELSLALEQLDQAKKLLDELYEKHNALVAKRPAPKTPIIHIDKMNEAHQGITLGFFWGDTQEGYDYWEDVAAKLLGYIGNHKKGE